MQQGADEESSNNAHETSIFAQWFENICKKFNKIEVESLDN